MDIMLLLFLDSRLLGSLDIMLLRFLDSRLLRSLDIMLLRFLDSSAGVSGHHAVEVSGP